MATSKTTTHKKKSKTNGFSQIGSAIGKGLSATGQGIKNTFMEMSEGLAGWIDDTSQELNGLGKNQNKKQNSAKKKTTKE